MSSNDEDLTSRPTSTNDVLLTPTFESALHELDSIASESTLLKAFNDQFNKNVTSKGDTTNNMNNNFNNNNDKSTVSIPASATPTNSDNITKQSSLIDCYEMDETDRLQFQKLIRSLPSTNESNIHSKYSALLERAKLLADTTYPSVNKVSSSTRSQPSSFACSKSQQYNSSETSAWLYFRRGRKRESTYVPSWILAMFVVSVPFITLIILYLNNANDPIYTGVFKDIHINEIFAPFHSSSHLPTTASANSNNIGNSDTIYNSRSTIKHNSLRPLLLRESGSMPRFLTWLLSHGSHLLSNPYFSISIFDNINVNGSLTYNDDTNTTIKQTSTQSACVTQSMSHSGSPACLLHWSGEHALWGLKIRVNSTDARMDGSDTTSTSTTADTSLDVNDNALNTPYSLKEDSIVASLPFSMIITGDVVRSSNIISTIHHHPLLFSLLKQNKWGPIDDLAIYMLHSLHHLDDIDVDSSFYSPYLQCLPTTIHTPLTWSARSKSKQYLFSSKSILLSKINETIINLMKSYDIFFELLFSYLGHIFDRNDAIYSRNSYLWIVSVITSRSHTIPIPVLRTVKTSVEASSVRYIRALIPLIDLLNYSSEPSVEMTVEKDILNKSISGNDESHLVVRLRTMRPISSMEELTTLYGSSVASESFIDENYNSNIILPSHSQLLLDYGFCIMSPWIRRQIANQLSNQPNSQLNNQTVNYFLNNFFSQSNYTISIPYNWKQFHSFIQDNLYYTDVLYFEKIYFLKLLGLYEYDIELSIAVSSLDNINMTNYDQILSDSEIDKVDVDVTCVSHGWVIDNEWMMDNLKKQTQRSGNVGKLCLPSAVFNNSCTAPHCLHESNDYFTHGSSLDSSNESSSGHHPSSSINHLSYIPSTLIAIARVMCLSYDNVYHINQYMSFINNDSNWNSNSSSLFFNNYLKNNNLVFSYDKKESNNYGNKNVLPNSILSVIQQQMVDHINEKCVKLFLKQTTKFLLNQYTSTIKKDIVTITESINDLHKEFKDYKSSRMPNVEEKSRHRHDSSPATPTYGSTSMRDSVNLLCAQVLVMEEKLLLYYFLSIL